MRMVKVRWGWERGNPSPSLTLGLALV